MIGLVRSCSIVTAALGILFYPAGLIAEWKKRIKELNASKMDLLGKVFPVCVGLDHLCFF